MNKAQRKPKVGEIVNFEKEGKNITATVMIFINRDMAMVKNLEDTYMVNFKEEKFEIVQEG